MAFDRTNAANLATLKTEIETDPDTIGYDTTHAQVGLNNTLINANSGSYTVTKPKIASTDIVGAVTYDAYNTLTQDEQEWLTWITTACTGGEEVDNLPINADKRVQLAGQTGGGGSNSSIWSAAHRTAMETAMLNLIDVGGSRAEDLFGFGTILSNQDLAAARDYVAA